MAIEMLKDIVCRKATAEGKKIRKLSDGGGLYLWVYENGKKYWRLRYSIAGKEKSLSLGVYPNVTLQTARELAAKNRVKLQNDLDPSEERKAKKEKDRKEITNTFQHVANEWYQKQLHTWVDSHATDVKRRLEVNIYPMIGSRPIDQIKAPELLKAIQSIEERRAFDLAHRVLGVCGQVFRYGIAHGYCERNLTADLRGALTPHKKKHQPAVHPNEFPKLIKAIASYETIGDMQTRVALQLLAHTFVRTSELINAEWREFNLIDGIWEIPAERMKMKREHLVPLTKQSIKLLHELKNVNHNSNFILTGRSGEKPISNNTLLFGLYRLGYKGLMTGHGFRAVASTILNESSLFRHDVIERQLAHAESDDVRSAYNRAQYLKERKDMMQWWSDFISSHEEVS